MPTTRTRRRAVAEFIRDRPGVVIGVAVVAVLVGAAFVGKFLADRSADDASTARVAEVTALLDGARPEQFLTYNAGTRVPGSSAAGVADQADLVSVVASSDLAFVRFQPDGWWSAFAERCVVAEVRPDAVVVRTEKRACVRVEPPRS